MNTDITRRSDDDQNADDKLIAKIKQLAQLEGVTPEEMFDRILSIVTADRGQS